MKGRENRLTDWKLIAKGLYKVTMTTVSYAEVFNIVKDLHQNKPVTTKVKLFGIMNAHFTIFLTSGYQSPY